MQQSDGGATDPRPLPRHVSEWWALVRHIGHEAHSDHVTMTAAGLAFYSLLGIVPVLAALAALFGLVASPATVRYLPNALRGFLPTQAVTVLENSLRGSGSSFGLGLGLAISLCIALWTAQWASSGLIAALNIAFDTAEQRGFVHRQIVALAVAIGGIALLYLAIVIVALLPAARSLFAVNLPYPLLLSIRWPLLALLFMLGLSTLYSHAPSRPRSHGRWLSWGAITATVLWIGASAAFSAYASRAGSFNRFYGSLGGVAIFLFWLYLSGLIVILGAEIDAEIAAWRYGHKPSAVKRMLEEREKSSAPDAERN